MKAARSCSPLTRPDVPDDFNPYEHRCESHKITITPVVMAEILVHVCLTWYSESESRVFHSVDDEELSKLGYCSV